MKINEKKNFYGLVSAVILAAFFLTIHFLLSNSNNQIIEIVIENKKLVRPESPISVEKGKHVVLKLNTDQAEEFHLDGYHAFSQLKPEKTMILEFDALSAGSFHFYLDRSKTFLGTIEIKSP